MKRIAKRAFTTVMVCLMFATPVFAASSYISKTLKKLNAVNGGTSDIVNFTTGSVSGADPSITSVKLSCNVASGTDPYTIYIKSPSGTIISIPGPASSVTITITGFEGEDLSGTWSVWIQNDGVSSNGNTYPYSSVTITAQIVYSY